MGVGVGPLLPPTLSSALDSPNLLPDEFTRHNLYVPAVDGAAIVVAVPAAVVIVGPCEKLVVPAGANQTLFEEFPLLLIFTAAPAPMAQLAGNT